MNFLGKLEPKISEAEEALSHWVIDSSSHIVVHNMNLGILKLSRHGEFFCFDNSAIIDKSEDEKSYKNFCMQKNF